jgi:hypothetical protein
VPRQPRDSNCGIALHWIFGEVHTEIKTIFEQSLDNVWLAMNAHFSVKEFQFSEAEKN